jgi:hypothetical protein
MFAPDRTPRPRSLVIAQCPLHRAGAALEQTPIAIMPRMRLRPWGVVQGVVSNGALAHPAEAIGVPNGMVRGGVLVDVVNGDLEVLYRRHSADWVRIVPLDEDDADNIERCTAYEIQREADRLNIQKITPRNSLSMLDCSLHRCSI